MFTSPHTRFWSLKNVMRQGRDTKAIKPKGASFKSNQTEMVFSKKIFQDEPEGVIVG